MLMSVGNCLGTDCGNVERVVVPQYPLMSPLFILHCGMGHLVTPRIHDHNFWLLAKIVCKTMALMKGQGPIPTEVSNEKSLHRKAK